MIWWTPRRKGKIEREVFANFKNVTAFVKIDGKQSREFYVGVHHGSILACFLFALVMTEIVKEVLEDDVRKLLHVDDLVLLGNRWKYIFCTGKRINCSNRSFKVFMLSM